MTNKNKEYERKLYKIVVLCFYLYQERNKFIYINIHNNNNGFIFTKWWTWLKLKNSWVLGARRKELSNFDFEKFLQKLSGKMPKSLCTKFFLNLFELPKKLSWLWLTLYEIGKMKSWLRIKEMTQNNPKAKLLF